MHFYVNIILSSFLSGGQGGYAPLLEFTTSTKSSSLLYITFSFLYHMKKVNTNNNKLEKKNSYVKIIIFWGVFGGYPPSIDFTADQLNQAAFCTTLIFSSLYHIKKINTMGVTPLLWIHYSATKSSSLLYNTLSSLYYI